MPKVLKFVLYGGIFLFSYFLFVYWMFPMGAIKSRLIVGIEKALGPDYQISIGTMSTYRITGARIQEISLFRLEEGKRQPVLKIPEAKARAGLFSLLFGSPKVRFHLDLPEGRFAGSVQKREEGFLIDGRFDRMDLGKIPLVRRGAGLNLASELEGDFQLVYNPAAPLRTEGNVEIRLDKLLLKKSSVPLGEMGTFDLPDLRLAKGPSRLKAQIGRGSIRLESFQLQGEDFEMNLQGRVFMASEVSRYRINVQGNFKFSDKLWGVFDPILPEPFASDLKKQGGKQGLLPLTISGQLAAPQVYSGALRLYPFKPF